MLNLKFMLRVAALLVMSFWAQNAAALSCPAVFGSPGANTAAEHFANATEDTCGGASFGAGPTRNGHIFFASEFGVTVQFIYNGVTFAPTSKSLVCAGAIGGAAFSTSISQTFNSAAAYSTVCTLAYTDIHNQLVTHTFGAGSQIVGGVLVGFLAPSDIPGTTPTGWFERTPPTVALTGLASTIGSTPQWVTITFSEPVTGFNLTNLNVANATITGYTVVSPSVYQVQLTRGGTGSVSFNVPADIVTDLAGNLNTASSILTATVDVTTPTVVLSGLAATAGPAVQTITATFSEDVTGFTLADIDAPFMTLSNFTAVSPSIYTFDLSNGRSVAVSVHIPAARVLDLAGNANVASNTLTATADPTPPSVWITGLPATVSGPLSFDATIHFSEPVTGFVVGDINITGGVVTAFSGSGATYSATVSATGVDDLVLSVNANVAQDAALNGNDSSGAFTALNVVVELTNAAITHFMQTRANALLGNQPDLAGFLRGGGKGKFAAIVTRYGGNAAFESGSDGPIWAQVKANWSTDSGAQGDYVFGALGAHSMLSNTFILGGMLQFDHLREVNGSAISEGTGWLLGPYFSAKLSSQPLYFEGSLLYGQTANTIMPVGTYTDAFSTERWLATLGVSGEITRRNLTLLPFLDAKYTSDTQAPYIDGLGNAIAAQTIGVAQVSAGLNFELALNGATDLNGGISGVWSNGSGIAAAPGFQGGRARVDLGVKHRFSTCNELSASGFYDGIGAADFESFGADLMWKTCF